MSEAAKLREFCLKVIIKNISRFIIAFESDDPVLAKNLEYLQRTESQVLLKEFTNNTVSNRYVKFILNCHLKKVIVPSSWNKTYVMDQLLVIASKTTKLRLPRCNFTTSYLCNLLSKMPNLTLLTLCLNDIEKPTLKCIRKCCPSLETLNLCCKVTDELIKTLCKDEGKSSRIRDNKIIQNLNIARTSVSAVGVAFILKHFPNLKSLVHKSVFDTLWDLHSTAFKSNSFTHLKPYNLVNLVVPDGKGDFDENVAQIFNHMCPHLTDISVTHVSSIVELSLFSELKRISICGEKGYYVDMSLFIENRGKNLETLVLKYCVVSAESLLRFCPKLKLISFRNVTFELPKGNDMSGYSFQHMESITFDGLKFSIDLMKSVVLILTSTPNLKTLCFTSISEIPTDFVTSYTKDKEMKNVEELDVSGSEFDPRTLVRLLNLFPNLKTYTVRDTVFANFPTVKRCRPSIMIISDITISDDESDEEIEDEECWMAIHRCYKSKNQTCMIS